LPAPASTAAPSGLNVTTLSKRIGRTLAHWHNVERGQTLPSLISLSWFSRVVGVELIDCFKWGAPMTPREPFYVRAMFGDLDHLDHAQHELDRAQLLLKLAVECDQRKGPSIDGCRSTVRSPRLRQRSSSWSRCCASSPCGRARGA